MSDARPRSLGGSEPPENTLSVAVPFRPHVDEYTFPKCLLHFPTPFFFSLSTQALFGSESSSILGCGTHRFQLRGANRIGVLKMAAAAVAALGEVTTRRASSPLTGLAPLCSATARGPQNALRPVPPSAPRAWGSVDRSRRGVADHEHRDLKVGRKLGPLPGPIRVRLPSSRDRRNLRLRSRASREGYVVCFAPLSASPFWGKEMGA